jgi:hypothetical protein
MTIEFKDINTRILDFDITVFPKPSDDYKPEVSKENNTIKESWCFHI